MSKYIDKYRNKKWYRICKVIMDSASFAMVLSVAFFAYEIFVGKKETKEVVDNLIEIQNSLSTKYLGLFPEYINNINILLEQAIDHQKNIETQDSVIIFQDVLYYGILSDPVGFRKMNKNLLTLAQSGCHITIAYYDLNSMPFRQMLRDALIDHQYCREYREYMTNHFQKLQVFNKEKEHILYAPQTIEYQDILMEMVNDYFPDLCAQLDYDQPIEVQRNLIPRALSDYSYVDSIVCERYFDSTKVWQRDKLFKRRTAYLRHIPQDKKLKDSITIQVNNMCQRLDDTKQQYLDKNFKNIHFCDFQDMYIDMSRVIIGLYSNYPNIELLPLTESLMMSCWLTKIGKEERAIFAFPSKYSTDEIGFVSQDEAISRYIHKMLVGIKNNVTQ